ncbi:DUF4298 domain-containing protein [Peptoniphilus asaccharolyticus]
MKYDVVRFERVLNESQEIVEELEKVLDKFENNLDEYNALKEYYMSEEYMKDFDLSNETKVYEDIAYGVLTEDSIYFLIRQMHENAIRMLELGTKVIKDN